MTRFEAVTLVPGRAHAATVHLSEPLSFWGGFDVETGRVIDRRHPQSGTRLAGSILLMTAGRGSSSGSSVLAEAIRRGTGPAGIVLLSRDAIVTVGALVARELYAADCPVVCAAEADWPRLVAAGRLLIEAGDEGARLLPG